MIRIKEKSMNTKTVGKSMNVFIVLHKNSSMAIPVSIIMGQKLS